jgi:hypothetical protein
VAGALEAAKALFDGGPTETWAIVICVAVHNLACGGAVFQRAVLEWGPLGSIGSAGAEESSFAVGLVLNAVDWFPDSSAVQQLGARAMAALCKDNAVAGRHVGAAGGARALVRAMEAFPDHIGVQQHACEALGNLAWRSRGNTASIVEEGGIVQLIGIMDSKPNEAGVQRRAATALGNAVTSDNEEKREEEGGRGGLRLGGGGRGGGGQGGRGGRGGGGDGGGYVYRGGFGGGRGRGGGRGGGRSGPSLSSPLVPFLDIGLAVIGLGGEVSLARALELHGSDVEVVKAVAFAVASLGIAAGAVQARAEGKREAEEGEKGGGGHRAVDAASCAGVRVRGAVGAGDGGVGGGREGGEVGE